MSRLALPLLLALALLGGPAMSGATGPRFVVYYSDAEPPEAFAPYDLLVLDSEHTPPLAPLAAAGKTLIGYLSVGEVEEHRAWFDAVKAEGLLLRENAVWRGSYFVDLRDGRWQRRVVEELIPMLKARGFHGVFLDTLDNPVELERAEPEKYPGMAAAAARLVRAIRERHPGFRIMMNRGFPLLPEVGDAIDWVLAESLSADYDFETKTYGPARPEDEAAILGMLAEAKKRHPKLGLLTLDYWNPDDPAGIARLYALQRGRGFAPYVATVELDRLVPEPP
ncbi:MAG TPA: endo alpha-1,4 polygalactosaminidase [Alphaproteobacteria bacterium]|nr:endo alpha-1,4 polygalactosaminidase [Alphaproteobacteria bacterium]